MIETNPDKLKDDLAKLEPGGELVLADGLYVGELVVPKTCWGMENQPTTIRAANRWKAEIQAAGGIGDGVQVPSYGDEGGHDLVIEGLRIWGGTCIGVRAQRAKRVDVRECRVSHFRLSGMLVNGSDIVVERNVIELNGQSNLDHGIYCSGSGLMLMDNLIRGNWGIGLCAYVEGGTAALSDSMIRGNLIYSHRGAGILLQSGLRNWITENRLVFNTEGLINTVPHDSNRIWRNIVDLIAPLYVAWPWRIDWPPLAAWMRRMGLPADKQLWEM